MSIETGALDIFQRVVGLRHARNRERFLAALTNKWDNRISNRLRIKQIDQISLPASSDLKWESDELLAANGVLLVSPSA